MLRGLLSMFLLGRVFRMFSGHHRSSLHRRSHSHYGMGGWGHRGHALDLGSLMGFHRRRRSFI